MTEQSPGSEREHQRRSAADLFLKVHDLDDTAGRPVVRLCNLIIGESLLTGGDELRILAPVDNAALIQLHRAGTWQEIMRVPAAIQPPLINRLKVMASLDIAKQPLQRGTIKVRQRGEVLTLTIEIRLCEDAEEASLRLPPRTTTYEEAGPLNPANESQ